MKFHEVDMQGKNWCERLPSLPTWEEAFIGRVVYNTSDGIIYYANPSKWVPLFMFKTIEVDGQDPIIADDVEDTLTIVAGDGIVLTTDPSNDALTITIAANFGKISVAGQFDVIAENANDVLTFATSNSGLSILTDPATDTITFRINYGGESFPSNPVAGMMWYRTDEKYWYLRNAANTGWIKLFHEDRPPLDQRDGGIFSADLLDGYQASVMGGTLQISANNLSLIGVTGANLSTVSLAGLSVAYAAAAGNADTLDGLHADAFFLKSQIIHARCKNTYLYTAFVPWPQQSFWNYQYSTGVVYGLF